MAQRHRTNSTGIFYFETGKGDKTYYVAYKTKEGKRVEKKVGKYSEGMRVAQAAKIRGELLQNDKFGIPVASKKKKPAEIITLNEVFTYYLTHKKMADNTAAGYKSMWDLHVKITLGRKDITAITTDDLIAFRDGLRIKHDKSESLSFKTKKLLMGLIGASVNLVTSINTEDAKRFKHIINPMPKLVAYDKAVSTPQIRKKESDNIRTRWLSLEEINELKEACSVEAEIERLRNRRGHKEKALIEAAQLEGKHHTELALYIELLLSTGARARAGLLVKRKHIDLNDGTIEVVDEKGVSTYTAYITPNLRKLLVIDLAGMKPSDNLIKADYYKLYKAFIQKADKLFNEGVTDKRERVVLHTLRHTFASHLAKNSVPINHIQKLMNHANVSITMRYAKLSPDAGKDQVISIYGGAK
ncbi:MAG: tyrosine-type recombinase/integrase [Sulfurimonadaceae bacterium]